MAFDKAVDSTYLDAGLTTIADAIRAKGGTSAPLEFPQGMADAVAAISGGGGEGLEGYTVTKAFFIQAEDWQNDSLGNAQHAAEVFLPESEKDTTVCFVKVENNITSNPNYQADCMEMLGTGSGGDGYSGFVWRANFTQIRGVGASTSWWISPGAEITVYKIKPEEVS